VTSSRIEPATFRPVALCVNQLRYCVPPWPPVRVTIKIFQDGIDGDQTGWCDNGRHNIEEFELEWSETRNLIITYSMELSPLEVASRSATKILTKILRKLKVHYRLHKSHALVPNLSHMHTVHTTTSYFSKILFNIIPLPTSKSSAFPTKFLYAFLFSPCVPHTLSVSAVTPSF
jgi:hypothetical protein